MYAIEVNGPMSIALLTCAAIIDSLPLLWHDGGTRFGCSFLVAGHKLGAFHTVLSQMRMVRLALPTAVCHSMGPRFEHTLRATIKRQKSMRSNVP